MVKVHKAVLDPTLEDLMEEEILEKTQDFGSARATHLEVVVVQLTFVIQRTI